MAPPADNSLPSKLVVAPIDIAPECAISVPFIAVLAAIEMAPSAIQNILFEEVPLIIFNVVPAAVVNAPFILNINKLLGLPCAFKVSVPTTDVAPSIL